MTVEYWLILLVPLFILSLLTYISAYYFYKTKTEYIGLTVMGGMVSKMMMFMGILWEISTKTELTKMDVIYTLLAYFTLSFLLILVILPLLKRINAKKPSK